MSKAGVRVAVPRADIDPEVLALVGADAAEFFPLADTVAASWITLVILGFGLLLPITLACIIGPIAALITFEKKAGAVVMTLVAAPMLWGLSAGWRGLLRALAQARARRAALTAGRGRVGLWLDDTRAVFVLEDDKGGELFTVVPRGALRAQVRWTYRGAVTYGDSTRPQDVHVEVFELSDGAEPAMLSFSGLFEDHEAALARWRERWGGIERREHRGTAETFADIPAIPGE